MSTPSDILARIDKLELDARQVVEGYLSGRHKSPRHGFAVEFAQHREYTPGDDIKHLDWKVFGRTERYHLKQYEQETNLVAWLVVDASESMSFASGARSKYDIACILAGAIAHLVLQQSDSIGMVSYADRIQQFLRPSARSGSHYRELLKLLATGPTTSVSTTGAVLNELAGRTGRRGIAFLISDLLDDVPEILDGIRHLKYQKHEVVVIHILDAAELDFPFRHPTLFKGLEQLPELSTDPLSVRDSYLAELHAHLGAIEEGCRVLQSDYLRVQTNDDLGTVLSGYFQKRGSR